MIKSILLSTVVIVLGSCSSDNKSNVPEKPVYRTDYSAPEITKPDFDVVLSRFEKDSLFGYKSRGGRIVIPAEYDFAQERFVNYGIVRNTGGEFMGIDSQGKFLYNIYFFDNGPDYIDCNRFRIIKDGKIGFANGKTGRIEILPELSYADYFNENLAVFCIGGEEKKTSDGEHSYWLGGNWGVIDTEGKVVVEPIYSSITHYQNGKAEAVLNGKTIQINKKGKQI
jgi:hypothetical protein